MESDNLDNLISRLESMMPEAPSLFGSITRHDWRPVWDLAKDIQNGFNSGVRYPTKELRQQAWNRFNSLRDLASGRANSERDQLRSKSESIRDSILSDCRGIGWSSFTDAIFFDRTSVDDMKSRGQYLARAMKRLSEHKHEMLAEHKQQCFERFQEIKAEHDRFWKEHHEAHSRRNRH